MILENTERRYFMFQKGNTYGDINLKEQRIGEIKHNNDGELMKIIEIRNQYKEIFGERGGESRRIYLSNSKETS